MPEPGCYYWVKMRDDDDIVICQVADDYLKSGEVLLMGTDAIIYYDRVEIWIAKIDKPQITETS